MKYPSIFQSKHLVYQDLGYGLKVSVRKEWRGSIGEGKTTKTLSLFQKEGRVLQGRVSGLSNRLCKLLQREEYFYNPAPV
jgi:hypothetical protein